MNIMYRSSLSEELTKSVLLLDTTALISASRYADFADFLSNLSKRGCMLIILPSVKYEFTRMARTQEQLDKCNGLISALGIGVYGRIDNKLNDEQVNKYLMIYNNCVNKSNSEKKASSFTDSLLCVMLYAYRNSWDIRLMSGNSRDMPLEFFDRKDLIVIDTGREIHVEGLYTFNEERYDLIKRKFERVK